LYKFKGPISRGGIIGSIARKGGTLRALRTAVGRNRKKEKEKNTVRKSAQMIKGPSPVKGLKEGTPSKEERGPRRGKERKEGAAAF